MGKMEMDSFDESFFEKFRPVEPPIKEDYCKYIVKVEFKETILSDKSIVGIAKIYKGKNVGDIYTHLKYLSYPYWPKVYYAKYEEKNDTSYIVEQFIQGMTLRERFNERTGRMNISSALQLCVAMCDALSYLHNLNPPIIHRDLKPENILYEMDFTAIKSIRLIDFDASRYTKKGADRDTRISVTAEYAAPEQWGSGQTDPRSDIYSLGVIMFEMITGKTVTEEQVVRPYCDEIIPYWDDLFKIIKHCVRTVRRYRYRNVEELKSDILHLISKADETAMRPFYAGGEELDDFGVHYRLHYDEECFVEDKKEAVVLAEKLLKVYNR